MHHYRHVLASLALLGCGGEPFSFAATFSDAADSGTAPEAQADASPAQGDSGQAGMGGAKNSGAGGSSVAGAGGRLVGTGSASGTGGRSPDDAGGSPAAGSTGAGGASPYVHCEDPVPCGSCTIPNGVSTVLAGCCRADHVCGYIWDGNCGPATASGCPY
jgi:hypothetical protein